MAGAVVPDYADLRSDFRHLLRHRGISTAFLFASGAVGLTYLILGALNADRRSAVPTPCGAGQPAARGVRARSRIAPAAGPATPSGIRPLLPLSDFRLRILPPGLRIPTGGTRDAMVHTITALAVMLGVLYLVYEHVR